MSSHKIQSIFAAAALAAGVSWLTAAPADAAPYGDDHSAGTPAAIACEERVEPQPNDGHPGRRSVTPQGVDPTMAIGQLAKEVGLMGLVTTRQVPGLVDLGGIAATWGMPSLGATSPEHLPMAPGPGRMEDLSTEAHVPALPPLPVPGTAPDMTLGRGPFHNGVTATPAKDLEKLGEVGPKVISAVLPNAAQGLGEAFVLPGVPGLSSRSAGTDNLSHLVQAITLQ